MQLINSLHGRNVSAARLLRVTHRWVLVVTENGHRMLIHLNREQQSAASQASFKDILREGLWIPVNTKLRQLFDYDWVVNPQPVTAKA